MPTKKLEPIGPLAINQLLVLNVVAAAGGYVTEREITSVLIRSTNLHLSNQSLSTALRSIHSKGLVVRTAAKSDSAYLYGISPLGHVSMKAHRLALPTEVAITAIPFDAVA